VNIVADLIQIYYFPGSIFNISPFSAIRPAGDEKKQPAEGISLWRQA